MRAIGVIKFGGPETLGVVDLPEPKVGPGKLCIRVKAATVNPIDIAFRAGAYAKQFEAVPPPYVPGMDAAGVVEEIGDGTETDLQVGDEVMAIVTPSGAYAERIVVRTQSVVKIPAGASVIEAATLPMNGMTARGALDELGLTPGQTLAVTGAAGAVGGYAIQMAKADGLRVIADASPDDEALVSGLGADVVVARGADVADRILEATPGGVDGLIDAAILDGAVLSAVRDGGHVATLRGFTAEERGITFHQIVVMTYGRDQAKLDQVRQLAESGQLTLRVARTYPADQAAEAHRALEGGGIRGRLVLEF